MYSTFLPTNLMKMGNHPKIACFQLHKINLVLDFPSLFMLPYMWTMHKLFPHQNTRQYHMKLVNLKSLKT